MSNSPQDHEHFSDEIQKICSEVIALIPLHGVSNETLTEACARLNLAHVVCMFPNGINDVLAHIFNFMCEYLTTSFRNTDINTLPRIRDKVSYLLKLCTNYHISLPSFREVTKALLVFFFSPKNIFLTSSLTFKLSDTIWHLTGDTSTKFDYYTKRLTVSAIYLSQLTYLITDMSADCAETLTFIDRRVENVLTFHKFKNRLKRVLPCKLDVQFSK